MKAVLVAVLFTTVVLAGCADPEAPTTTVETEDGQEKQLRLGKGGILGLVIDDRFRPIPEALVLVQPAGITVTTNDNGEFEVPDLEPGSYSLRVSADGHEAAPQSVNVREGEFAEASIMARRVINQDGQVITNEYSVFIPCAADFVVNGIVWNCVLDLSGDTYRPGFTTNYTEYGDTLTYWVTEMRANAVGNYVIQVRENDGSSAGGDRYAVDTVIEGDYIKMVLERGVATTEHNDQNNAVPWYNNETNPIQTIMFMEGEYKSETNQAAGVTCVDQGTQGNTGCSYRGVGAQMGIRATFVHTLFVGEPDVDVQTYCVLC